MNKRDLARRLREECEVVKRLEHQHYLDGMALQEIADADAPAIVLAADLQDIARKRLEVSANKKVAESD